MNVDATLQTIGIFTTLSIRHEDVSEHPRVELVAFDKGFIDHKDEGKVGYYLFDPVREESVPITRKMAEVLYTLSYPMSWDEWDEKNHELCMSYA